MKKILLLFILLLTAHFSQAQTEQGKFVIDAKSNFAFINNTPNDGVKNEFYINLQGGYAILNNLFVGPSVNYYSRRLSDFNSSPNQTIKGFRLSNIFYGAFAKYYFNFQEDPKVMPYLGIGYFLGSDKLSDFPNTASDATSQTISDSTSINKLSVDAGVSIFLIPKSLSLDLNLNYTKRDFLLAEGFFDPSNSGDLKIYQFNLGFSLFL